MTTRDNAPQPAPAHGDHAADLVFDTHASVAYPDGIWMYPACYDDFYLARRRAHSLSQGFGVPFQVDLFGAAGECGELTTSAAVYAPGYYPFTRRDPRPYLILLPAVDDVTFKARMEAEERQEAQS